MNSIEEAIQYMENEKGFFRNNNYHVEKADNDECIVRADIDDNSMNPYQIIHGGLIFGLGDTTMGLHLANNGYLGVTLNANINYLRPAKGKSIYAKSQVIKKGINTSYIRCDIYNDKDEIIATMDANYFHKK